MIKNLVRKELRQHGWALGLIALLALGGYGLILVNLLIRGDTGSIFEGVRFFILTLVPLSAIVLGRRLVVCEYQSRTQLFLEGLPISRAGMFWVKYFLGLAVMAAILLGVLGLTWFIAVRNEEPGLLRGMCLRGAAFTWFAYNLFFMMGFLGRYRAALFLALMIALTALTELTELELSRFGPIQLLDQKFAYESGWPPRSALLTTLRLAGAFLGLAFLMGSLREGSVAALLAERMSHRERVVVAALLVGLLFAMALLAEKQKKTPFDLHGALVGQAGSVVVKVIPAGEGNQAQQLADHAALEVDALQAYLGLNEVPRVFITYRRDLDPDAYEKGTLTEAEGLLVRANYGAADWDERDFLAWLVREVLVAQSRGRAKLEAKMWVLDGFPLWWVRRAAPVAAMDEDPSLALPALVGTSSGFGKAQLQRWYRFREQIGEEMAAAVAWSGLVSLQQRCGPEGSRRFLRSVLGANLPKDFRAYLHERNSSLPWLLESQAGLSFEDFLEGWERELAAGRLKFSESLAQLPELRGEIEFVPLAGGTTKIRYQVRIDPKPAEATRYSVVYHELPVLDEEVDPRKLNRVENRYGDTVEGELPETFARGARLYWTISMEVPALGCKIISGWQREEVR